MPNVFHYNRVATIRYKIIQNGKTVVEKDEQIYEEKNPTGSVPRQVFVSVDPSSDEDDQPEGWPRRKSTASRTRPLEEMQRGDVVTPEEDEKEPQKSRYKYVRSAYDKYNPGVMFIRSYKRFTNTSEGSDPPSDEYSDEECVPHSDTDEENQETSDLESSEDESSDSSNEISSDLSESIEGVHPKKRRMESPYIQDDSSSSSSSDSDSSVTLGFLASD